MFKKMNKLRIQQYISKKDKIVNTRYKKIIIRKLVYGLLLLCSSITTILNESKLIKLDKSIKIYLAFFVLIFIFTYESYIAFKNAFIEVDEQLIYTTDDEQMMINDEKVIKDPHIPLNESKNIFILLKNNSCCKKIDEFCGC